MRFTINLATRTYLDQRLIKQVIFTVAALLIIALLWNVYRATTGYGELRRLRSDIAAYEARLNTRPKDIPEKDYSRLLADIGFFNTIIEKKTFGWLGLLEQLENTLPDGVSLASISPDKNNKTFKLEGRATSFASVQTFMERLYNSKYFSQVLLLSHQEVTTGTKSRGIQFSISCNAALK